jgi:hypothetical protein
LWWQVLENCRACPELVSVVGENAVSGLATACDDAAPLTPVLPRTPSFQDDGGTPRDADADAHLARLEVVRPALQALFGRLMRAEPATVVAQLDALVSRIARTTPMLRAPLDELAVRLHEQYPGDVGACARRQPPDGSLRAAAPLAS